MLKRLKSLDRSQCKVVEGSDEPRGRSPSLGRRATSLGGGKVRSGRQMHGTNRSPSPGAVQNGRVGRSRTRHEPLKSCSGRPKSTTRDDRSKSRTRDDRSKSRTRDAKPRARREYDTPFDDKGRCHYHVNMQLAAKKMTGGWKVLHQACPKCMEENVESCRGDKSINTTKPNSSSGSADANGKRGKLFDNNGCCIYHPHIQVAKKTFLGGGWKVRRVCPSCNGGTVVGLDDMSVKSDKSGRSNSSRKSALSKKGAKVSHGKAGQATQSGRYGALPFDADGFCCHHPSVRIAQRKFGGGFKIVHDVCPDCAAEKETTANSGARSGRHRSSSRHKKSDELDVDEPPSPKMKKKRIRVKNLKTEDENGRRGRYSGYVNNEHMSHGEGIMKYDDGDEWVGVWSNGSQVRRTRREINLDLTED